MSCRHTIAKTIEQAANAFLLALLQLKSATQQQHNRSAAAGS